MTSSAGSRHLLPNSYPHLSLVLSSNERLKTLLFDAYKNNPAYLEYLDQLIQELLNRKVQGVAEKLLDADRLRKFYSIVSELEIARLLGSKGKEVILLTDDVWEGKSPDMIVSDVKHVAYVEVKRLEQDETAEMMEGEILESLPQLQQSMVIDINLKGELALPVTDWRSREAKEKIAKECVLQFKDKILKVDLAKIPLIIETTYADFRVRARQVYPRVVSTDVFRVPEETLIQRMVYDVSSKSGKRQDWAGEQLARPYIVALSSEHAWIDSDMVRSAFLGSPTVLHGAVPWPKISIPSKVELAKKRGWENYLLEECIIPNKNLRCYLPEGKEGAFLLNDKMKDISAVLIWIAFTGRYYFFPNPFASEEINYPSLCNFVEPRMKE